MVKWINIYLHKAGFKPCFMQTKTPFGSYQCYILMAKTFLLSSLWGAWVLHFQMLLIALLAAVFPQGYWWAMAFFLLSFLLLSVIILLNYLWVVFVLFEKEGMMVDIDLKTVLLTLLMFVVIPMGVKLHRYYHFATEKVQIIENGLDETNTKGLFLFKNAKLIDSLTLETSYKHWSQSKGHAATSYLVHYKITPLVFDSDKTQNYRYFLTYNSKDKSTKIFDLQYVAVLAGYSKHRESYPYLLNHWAKKYAKKQDKEPIFIELIDLPKVQAESRFYFWLLYGIVFGIWFGFTLILPFSLMIGRKTKLP